MKWEWRRDTPEIEWTVSLDRFPGRRELDFRLDAVVKDVDPSMSDPGNGIFIYGLPDYPYPSSTLMLDGYYDDELCRSFLHLLLDVVLAFVADHDDVDRLALAVARGQVRHALVHKNHRAYLMACIST